MGFRFPPLLAFVLVLCMLAIVYSPFVDLPPTVFLTHSAVAAFCQIVASLCVFVLARSMAPVFSTVRSRAIEPERGPTRNLQLINFICTYLC
jgi:hypothetical protein